MRVSTIAVIASTLLCSAACGEGPTGLSRNKPSTPGSNLPPLGPVASAVKDAFQREFGESIPRPTIFNDTLATTCTGKSHLMTVAYLPAASTTQRRIYSMYMTHDGASVIEPYDGQARYGGEVIDVIPAGTFRVLTVLLTYPQTLTANALPAWRQAQAVINDQHAAFAHSRGYPAPIVQFVFTNSTVAGAEVADPYSVSGIRAALEPTGMSTSGYDFVVVINLAPGMAEGGFATVGDASPHFVYIGNLGRWAAAPTSEQLAMVAGSAYHHEIGHHWGWQHDWTPTCGDYVPFAPFITGPILFGWEDTDGDGVPEILDATPYGRVP
jgi:hypothetical protein